MKRGHVISPRRVASDDEDEKKVWVAVSDLLPPPSPLVLLLSVSSDRPDQAPVRNAGRKPSLVLVSPTAFSQDLDFCNSDHQTRCMLYQVQTKC